MTQCNSVYVGGGWRVNDVGWRMEQKVQMKELRQKEEAKEWMAVLMTERGLKRDMI